MIHGAAKWFDAGVKVGRRGPGEAPRWERCISHQGPEVGEFARLHLGEPHRRILLLGGAGFDPRSLAVAKLVKSVAGGRVDGVFIRERRPNPNPAQLMRADSHAAQLSELIAGAAIEDVKVFDDSDGAVVIGRNVLELLRSRDLARFTDVIVDFSALSIGSSFPLTRFALELIDQQHLGVNLHAIVTARPRTDDGIVPSPSAVVSTVHGFPGRWNLEETARAARLWMPQLRRGHQPVLELILGVVDPHDVVPVLPFPSIDPRAGDRLVDAFASEFETRWGVDARSLVYADEFNPLDFYRTVLRIHDGRFPVFEETGGSQLVLSPIGSKVLAIGAMMAAIERDLPVMYIEALAYSTEFEEKRAETYSEADMVHVWLCGHEVYPAAKQGSLQ